MLEPGRLGTWLVGEAGALLVRGRRVHCFCVRVNDPDLPSADRIAHLLLALRTDEQGFATVANQAFAGARWRVRRRLPEHDAPRARRRARSTLLPQTRREASDHLRTGGRNAGLHRFGHRAVVRDRPNASTILSMTALSHSGRVLLVPEARVAAAGPEAAKIRRYRLARLRLLERRDAGADASRSS